LDEWAKNGWLRPHAASRGELERLYRVVRRDLREAAKSKIDADWRFAMAYNAALQSAAAALYSAGYEATKGGGAHHRTIESILLTVGDEDDCVAQLQTFRAKRGGGIYEETDVATDAELTALRELAARLFDRVRAWVAANHAALAPKESSGKR
jgi:hypothetical protein